MAEQSGKKYTSFPGLHLKSRDSVRDAAILMDNVNSAPTTVTGKYYLYVSGGALKFDNGSSVTTISTGGGGGVPSWETLYTNDATFNLSTATWTITQSGAFDLLTLTKSNVGAGSVLAINNSGTGADILGTSSTWSVSKAGAIVATKLVLGDDESIEFGATTDAVIKWVNASSVLNIAGAVDFDNNVTLAASATIVQAGAAGSTVFTITAGDVVWSDASLAITDADNAESFTLINNTATTIGAAASAAIMQIESTSLTTGAAVNVQLTEGTLNGGFYYSAWDATAGARVWSVGEDGVMTMAGTAGSNSFTMTAGDQLMSDGSLTIVDADNAATFSVTNDTATTASVFVLAGSGVFSGSTTTSFATITASGLTSGTVLYLPAAGLTTGKVVNIVAAAATDGILVDITGGGANMTATGRIAKFNMGAATVGQALELVSTGVYSGAGLLTVTANSATTGSVVTVSGTGLTSGYGISATGGGANMTANGAVIGVNMGAATDGAGLSILTTGVYIGSVGVFSVTANSASTGVVASIAANGLTTGTGFLLTSSGTIATTGELASFVANSATTSTGVIRVSATGLTDGIALSVTGGGANMTATGSVASLLMGAATAGTGLAISTTGVYTGTTGVLSVTANSATTGGVAVISANGLTSGVALQINATEATLTTGKYIQCYDGAAADFTVGKYGATVIAGNASTTVLTVTAGNTLFTAGNLTFTDGSIIQTPQAIVNANTAIDITHGITTIANNALSTHTMADGTVGQRKTIVCTVYTADATITPTNLANGTNVVLNAVGDACDMVFLGTEWWVTNLYGTAAIT